MFVGIIVSLKGPACEEPFPKGSSVPVWNLVSVGRPVSAVSPVPVGSLLSEGSPVSPMSPLSL